MAHFLGLDLDLVIFVDFSMGSLVGVFYRLENMKSSTCLDVSDIGPYIINIIAENF